MTLKLKPALLFFIVVSSYSCVVQAQDPRRLEKEVSNITSAGGTINKKDIVLFTGSSSIRMWKSLQSDFPDYNVVNHGFGGSETSDLIFYFDKLITPYHPKKIFIYEGDNDLNSGKSPEAIIGSTDSLITLIREHVSAKVPIYFISPKPSIARWRLKEKYLDYNKRLQALVSKRKNVHYIDVWSVALDSKGNVIQDIFLEDGLHMNSKGYAIWVKEVRKYLP